MPSTTSRSPATGSLAPYRRKRNFARTPEPAGGSAVAGTAVGLRRFVVQRHRARRLHYDFRLGGNGVLVSWAGPQGPTLDPAGRRGGVRGGGPPPRWHAFVRGRPPGGAAG